MPINTNVRSRNHLTGASKEIAAKQIVNLFGFIGLHELAPVFEPQPQPEAGAGEAPKRKRGRKAAYPPISLLATLASGRATGSLTSALALLHEDRELWARCATAYAQRSGVQLPPLPPTRDQVIHFRDRLTGDRALMERLQLRFRRLAVGQARRQGNLLTGITPNGADPLEAHAIYGDGTVIAKYSDVREITDPITGERIVMGGRAKDSNHARIQRTVSDTLTEDNKNTNGLNMVAMHTWTTGGRITLGTGVALGGEAWAALELIESIHGIAGDGIHSVIYDRALTGWHVDHLMANLRIQVIGKAVGASSSRTDNEDQAWDRATDADIKDAVGRLAAEHGVTE